MSHAVPDNGSPGRLDDVLAAYLEAVDGGWAPDRRQLLARYPDLAPDLASFFQNNDAISKLARPTPSFAHVPTVTGLRAEAMPATNASDEAVTTPYSKIAIIRQRFFGDFELLEELPHGGMGAVYKARKKGLDRCVALKTMRAGHFASDVDVQRFQSEARQLSQLDHPNIVPIYDVDEHDGRHYFTMKFIEGGSLADRIADWQLAVCDAETRKDATGRRWSRQEIRERKRRIIHLVIQVARAVQHAHDHAVLHRDLKPGNILLDAQEQPHVADFGLATRLDGDPGGLPLRPESPRYWTDDPSPSSPPNGAPLPSLSTLTETGATLGTPAYMAPEQARGRKGGLSTATDVYGLGAILYKLLTGRAPIEGTSREEILQKLAEETPMPPRAVNPNVDRDLEAVCVKCLRKDPAERYASAEALAQELERCQRGEPVHARVRSWPARLWRRVRRNAVLASITAVIGFAGGAALLYNRMADPDRPADRYAEALKKGQPVSLLGESGRPAWLRWPLGEGEFASEPGKPFSFSTVKERLVTLLPRVPAPRYRFSADIRHDNESGISYVGLFFAYQVRPSGNTLQHEWIEFTFPDYGIAAGAHPPRLGKNKDTKVFSITHLWLMRHIESDVPGQFAPGGYHGIYSNPVEYLPPDKTVWPHPWRHLEIVVEPDQFSLRWESELIAPVLASMVEQNDRRPWMTMFPAGQYVYEPQGALGLVVREGQASFKNVVVEPLP